MANAGYLLTVPGILKIAEIIFVLTSFGLMRDKSLAFYVTEDTCYLGIGITMACIIVTPLLLICYLMGRMEIQQSIFEVCVNALFGVCLVVFGSMAMVRFTNLHEIFMEGRDYGISMSFFSIAAGGVYLADTVYAVQKFRQDVKHEKQHLETGLMTLPHS